MIHSRAELLEHLKDMLALEMTARKSYDEDILYFENLSIIKTLQEIKNDEDEHIELLGSIIDLLEV